MGLFSSPEKKAEKAFQSGYEAMYRGRDDDKAEQQLKIAAGAGHLKAMYHYGVLHKKQSKDDALEWIERAAQAGFDEAVRYCVGFYSGSLPDADPAKLDAAKAAHWAKRGAEMGLPGMEQALADIAAADTPEKIYQLALELEKQHRYAGALRRMRQAGEAGHIPAMLWCARMLQNDADSNLPKESFFANRKEAESWYRRAAEAEQNTAGSAEKLYETALEQSKRGQYASALACMERAAEAGHIPAMLWCTDVLGRRTESRLKDEGIAKDIQRASEWAWRAAATGDAEALYRCGLLYEACRLIPPEGHILPSAAEECYEKAVLARHLQATGRFLQYFEEKQKTWSFEPFVGNCQRMAREGDDWAGYLCAEMKLRGGEITVANARLLQSCEAIAKQEFPLAQYACGRIWEQSELTAPDLKKALFWYEEAAKGGHPAACLRAGEMYANGEGCQKDPLKGLSLLENSVVSGPAAARVRAAAAQALLAGDGGMQNRLKACRLYHQAALDTGARVEIEKTDSLARQFYKIGSALFTRQEYAMAVPLLQQADGYFGAHLKLAMLYYSGVPGLFEADYEKACAAFRRWLRGMAPGDPVQFGSYPISGDPQDYRSRADNDPIYWQVLTVQDDCVLLLCRYGLEFHRITKPLFDPVELPFVDGEFFNLNERELNRYLVQEGSAPLNIPATISAVAKEARKHGFDYTLREDGIEIHIEEQLNMRREADRDHWQAIEFCGKCLTSEEAVWVLDEGKYFSPHSLRDKVQTGKFAYAVVRPALWLHMPPEHGKGG